PQTIPYSILRISHRVTPQTVFLSFQSLDKHSSYAQYSRVKYSVHINCTYREGHHPVEKTSWRTMSTNQ
ncbi:Hypothetical protein FKW44_000838, partial [Caligus rogercresseyi]